MVSVIKNKKIKTLSKTLKVKEHIFILLINDYEQQ